MPKKNEAPPGVPMGHSVKFTPGYDLSKSPGGYGVDGMRITFFYRGKRGAVQFVLSTDWIPWGPKPSYKWSDPDYSRIRQDYDTSSASVLFPMGVDLGYHSPVPHYDGQPWLSENCEAIGGKCYYDGSGLNAQPILLKLIYEGEEVVRKELESYYEQVFGR